MHAHLFERLMSYDYKNYDALALIVPETDYHELAFLLPAIYFMLMGVVKISCAIVTDCATLQAAELGYMS